MTPRKIANSLLTVPVTTRVTYVRVRAGVRFFVIADLGPDGLENFADQEAGEVVWVPFTPSPSEREFAVRLAECGGSCRWAALFVERDITA